MGFEYRFLIKVNYSASIFMHNNCNFAAIQQTKRHLFRSKSLIQRVFGQSSSVEKDIKSAEHEQSRRAQKQFYFQQFFFRASSPSPPSPQQQEKEAHGRLRPFQTERIVIHQAQADSWKDYLLGLGADCIGHYSCHDLYLPLHFPEALCRVSMVRESGVPSLLSEKTGDSFCLFIQLRENTAHSHI